MKIIPLKKNMIALTIILIIFIMSFSVSMAAWWGTPGYEWAVSTGLTGIKSQAQLYSEVELDDLYATILKYLSMKSVYPKDKSIHHEDELEGMDNTARGIIDIINGYNTRKSLTIQQFYIVENYAEKGYDTLEEYKAYSQKLTRQELRNIESYLRLSKYRAATLISDRSDREYAIARLGYVKNAKIINYGMLPYTNKLTRREFLTVMYDLLTEGASNSSTSRAVESFENAGVLIGYDTGLELDKLLDYVEMYTFLYRFEIYDFATGGQKSVFSDIEKYIDAAYEGNISREDLISYLQDLAENTNYQVDLITRIEKEIGDNWTVKQAGDLMYDIYTTEGFSYSNGRTRDSVKGKK